MHTFECAPEIASATVNPSSTAPLTSFSFTGNTVVLDYGGQTIEAGEFTLVDVTFAGGDPVLEPIQSIDGLTSIDIFESTGTVQTFSYAPGASALLARRSGALGPSNNDFVGVIDEFYDVFYSNFDGAPNPSGSYLTFEARWDHEAPSGGGLNIAGVRLNTGAGAEWAHVVASYVALGSTYIPGSEALALGSNLSDDSTMGNTVGTSERLRLTLGFSATECLPEPSPHAVFAAGASLIAWLARGRGRKRASG